MNTASYKGSIFVFVLISVIFPSHTNAQQLLNFDFEKLSIEGIARPWGWDVASYSSTTISLDSAIKQHGKYSLKMDAAATGEAQALAFSFDPFVLQNKTVTIEGWMKTNELKGKASFFLNYIVDGDTAETVIKSKEISNSTGWTWFSVNKKLPGKINSIYLKVQHEGSGTAWFDNFSLAVNNKKRQELEIATSFTDRQVKWLNDNSSVVNSFDASPQHREPAYHDLDFFKSIAGDARIIALGESTHGTSEFFKLKHRVLEYCIIELGVRIFAIEDHQLVVGRVNKYVLGGPGTARESMYGMLGVWQTKEVHDMIGWIRAYNDLHPDDKVEFTGFDIQNHTLPIDSLYSFVDRQAADISQPVKELLGDLQKNGANSYSVTDSVKAGWFNNAKKVLDMISGLSASWLSKANNGQDSLAIYWGIQYANLVKQFAENTYKGHASLYRDIAMAENVSWIINVYKPRAKAMLWAHDVHISRGDHLVKDMNIYFGNSMGSHLSKKYGPAYKSFGLFTYQGSYSCYVSYTNFKVTDCPLYQSPRGSLDEALHRVILTKKSPGLLLDLSKARSISWLTKLIPVRFANHVNIEYGYWTQHSIPYQFDGIFFIDKTSSAKSYARK
jgi:erythromycin esterase